MNMSWCNFFSMSLSNPVPPYKPKQAQDHKLHKRGHNSAVISDPKETQIGQVIEYQACPQSCWIGINFLFTSLSNGGNPVPPYTHKQAQDHKLHKRVHNSAVISDPKETQIGQVNESYGLLVEQLAQVIAPLCACISFGALFQPLFFVDTPPVVPGHIR